MDPKELIRQLQALTEREADHHAALRAIREERARLLGLLSMYVAMSGDTGPGGPQLEGRR